MSVIAIVLPLALLLGGAAVYAFIHATKQGQFDDLDSPPHRAIHDDEASSPPPRSGRGVASPWGRSDGGGVSRTPAAASHALPAQRTA
ncbi:MAG: cbb3-type cytochrome oxidase assembly protein CcoS [Planctomycetota bacterium]